jgi:hypothetical protein
MESTKEKRDRLETDGVLSKERHPSSAHWFSPTGEMLVVASDDVKDFMSQAELIHLLGYTLSGNINIVKEKDRSLWVNATFLAQEPKY